MLLNDDEIKERIESPLNLLNRLRSSLNKSLNGTTNKTIHPSLPPKSEDIIDDLENKISNSSARSKAMGIMISAMDELKARLPEVEKPEKLAIIAHEMSKVISNQDTKATGHSTSQIIVYAPQVQSLESYEIIDVSE
jgi:hypothetical protein